MIVAIIRKWQKLLLMTLDILRESPVLPTAMLLVMGVKGPLTIVGCPLEQLYAADC